MEPPRSKRRRLGAPEREQFRGGDRMARGRHSTDGDSSDTRAKHSTEPDVPSKPDEPRFDNLKNLAYAGIFVVFGAAISVNDFSSMWVLPASQSDAPLFIARIVLFAEFVVLTFRWIV